MGPYPRLRNDTAALLDVPERYDRVAAAIKRWNWEDLEEAGEAAGVIMPMCRTTTEIVETEQYRQVLAPMAPVVVERIGDSEPEPLSEGARAPLEGMRALGRAHIIAGAGLGRALALHGADVLNVWDPNEYEMPMLYLTSNVGMRSTRLDLKSADDDARMKRLLAGADIFFANRRPTYLTRRGLDAETAAAIRPGIIHATVNLNGETAMRVSSCPSETAEVMMRSANRARRHRGAEPDGNTLNRAPIPAPGEVGPPPEVLAGDFLGGVALASDTQRQGDAAAHDQPGVER